jgi:hypothetical protein
MVSGTVVLRILESRKGGLTCTDRKQVINCDTANCPARLPPGPRLRVRRSRQEPLRELRQVRGTRTVGPPQVAARLPRRLAAMAAFPHGKGGDSLAVTFSVLALLGVAVFVLCRYAGLRVLHALVCVLLGFYLASSSLAPDISRIVTSIIHAL